MPKPRTQRHANTRYGRPPSDANQRVFEWGDADKTPHWLKYGKGHAGFEAFAYVNGPPQLHFDANEYGDKSGKRVMFTMDAEASRAFYDWLRTLYADADDWAERNRINNTPRDGA